MSEYARRLERWSAIRRQAERVELRWSLLRIGIFVAGIVVAWQAFASTRISGAWLFAPAAAFVVAMTLHDRVIRRRREAERAQTFYEQGSRRAAGTWTDHGDAGERFRDPLHPYAADLDLFGRGSLFQRLCRARTEFGRRRLATWLCRPADNGSVRERQQAVRELVERLDVREGLAITGEDPAGPVDLDGLRRWLAGGEPTPAWPAVAALVLGIANVVTLALWWSPLIDGTQPLEAFWSGSAPFLVCGVASLALAGWRLGRTQRVLHDAGRPAATLQLFSALMQRIEAESFESPRLRQLHEVLAPSAPAIGRLRRWVEVHESRANMILAGLGGLVLLGTQLALALERWRERYGNEIGDWFEALAEFEALSSIATYAYERPNDVMPELADDGLCYRADDLGHPLIRDESRVCNDLVLDGERKMYLVSGSNMSGKSTWLRSIGINAVLAYAGAPVCARKMTISPLQVGASMRIADSLQEGLSHFYAEIKRLRELVDLTDGERPLLFLLDEILHGTNSHDRRIGAQALVQGLVERGGVGLVTTHDLALAEIAERLAPHAANVHFADRLEGDRVVFDYRLRDGVVDHSNALALMRAIGLDV